MIDKVVRVHMNRMLLETVRNFLTLNQQEFTGIVELLGYFGEAA